MIDNLNEQRCFELLASTTVGRLGFVTGERVSIIPVNYTLDGRDILVRASSDGVLSAVPGSAIEPAFEVDHHDDLAGTAWSVLLSGPVAAEQETEPFSGRAAPWAGGERTLLLRLQPSSISGRIVRREPG